MNSPPVVILDTSVLKKNVFLSTGDGVWLLKLAEKKLIELYLPFIVKHEILSQFEKSYAENTSFAFDQFSKLIRKNEINEALNKSLNSIQKEVDSIFEAKKKSLHDFYNSKTFEIAEIHKDDAINVFNNYFKGAGNFTEAKNRKDIPDAFIFEVVKRLAAKRTVFVLSDDEKLSAAIDNKLKTKVYKAIEDIFEKENVFRSLKAKLEKEIASKKEADVVQKAFDIDVYLSMIESGSVFDDISEKLFHESLSDMEGENYIQGVNSISLIEKDVPLEYLGKGEGRIEFDLEVEVELEHYVHRGDMRDYYGKQGVSIESVNDHVYEVTEPAVLKVSMESRFNVDYELLKKAVKEEWKGKKLGRELGARIKHDLEVVSIDLISFPESGPDEGSDESDDNDYAKYCTTCGKEVGTCEH